MSSLPFQVCKGHRAERTMRPSEPVLWRSSAAGTHDAPDPSSPRPCLVCLKYEARYTCPKCLLVYCSKGCYADHKGSSSDCAEQFYQDRIMEVMNLETKARREDFSRTLNRIYMERQDIPSIISGDLEESFDREELLQILQVLERGDEQELATLLRRRPQLRTALNAALERGELCDWVLEPWHPWWRPELLTKPLEAEDPYDEPDSTDEICQETLDERLLACRPFSTLRPKGKGVPVQLRFNLLDILSSLVSTLRLYHGFRNAIEMPVDAAHHLIQSSQVLCDDFRFGSVEEVLLSVSGRFVDGCGPSVGRDASVTIIRDLALLCRNRRLIGRALLEAADILSAAIKLEAFECDQRLIDSKTTKNAERKIMYYLSWSLDAESSPFFGTLSEDVSAWLDDWDTSNAAQQVDTLGLPEHSPRFEASLLPFLETPRRKTR